MIRNFNHKKTMVARSIEALMKKNLLPDRSKGFFTTDKYDMFVNYMELQPFKEWTCPTCQISVYGPKKLLVEHHKIHAQKKEIKENEIYQREYNIYHGNQ